MGKLARSAGYIAASLLMFLAACSSPSDPALAALKNPPKPDAARIVVYYPAPIMGSNGMVQIKWNDKLACDLGSGEFLVREVAPAKEVLGFSFCGIRGTSTFKLKAEGGHSYYLRILPYDSSVRGIASGYPSEFDEEGKQLTLGPLKIERVEEEEAFKDLESLSLVHR